MRLPPDRLDISTFSLRCWGTSQSIHVEIIKPGFQRVARKTFCFLGCLFFSPVSRHFLFLSFSDKSCCGGKSSTTKFIGHIYQLRSRSLL